MKATTRQTRDRRSNDPAFIEYLADVAAEQAAEKAAQDAADRAAAQTPEAQYKASTNKLFAEEQNVVLNGVMSDAYLSQFGTIKRGRCSEEQKVAARTAFRATATDYIRTEANGNILVSMVDRNGLHPGDVTSYLLCHEICKIWAAYPEVAEAPAPVAEVAPVVEVAPVLSRSEQAILDHQKYCEEIIGHDESGKGWTMQMVDALPSKEMLRLLRLFEQGHRGSNLLTVRREILDIKQQQDAKRERIAAEDAR